MRKLPGSHERSHEQELRDLLTGAATPTREEILAELAEIQRNERPGPWPKTEDLIREDRDRR